MFDNFFYDRRAKDLQLFAETAQPSLAEKQLKFESNSSWIYT